MEVDFYTELLGIPPGHRPPPPHVLLGLPEKVDDEIGIEEAAKRQMDRLDRFALSPDADVRAHVQQMMNAVAHARNVLLEQHRADSPALQHDAWGEAKAPARQELANPKSDLGAAAKWPAVASGLHKLTRHSFIAGLIVSSIMAATVMVVLTALPPSGDDGRVENTPHTPSDRAIPDVEAHRLPTGNAEVQTDKPQAPPPAARILPLKPAPKKPTVTTAPILNPGEWNDLLPSVDNLMRLGWYSGVASVLEDARREKKLPNSKRSEYERLLGMAMLKRAESCVEFGNLRMASDAIRVCRAIDLGQENEQRLKIITSTFEANRSGVAFEAKPLRYEKAIAGAHVWTDEGHGYKTAGRIQIGGNDKKSGGNVTVAPGLVVENGKMFVRRGSMTMKGTPDRPVIFRNVNFTADLHGRVTGEHVIFEDCTFSKGGAWSVKRFSSKWVFSNCIFLRSSFHDLGEKKYGIRITDSSFVRCKLPSRMVPYRHEWNQVERCYFLECSVAPSFVWCTNRCDFLACRAVGTNSYNRSPDLAIHIHVPKDHTGFLTDVKKQSLVTSEGKVVYTNSPDAFVSQAGNEKMWPLCGGQSKTVAPK